MITRRETIASRLIRDYASKGYGHIFTLTGKWNGRGTKMHTGSMLFSELEHRGLTIDRDLKPGVIIIRGAMIKKPDIGQLLVFRQL